MRHPNTREHALGSRALEYNEMSHTPTLGRVEVPETEVGAIRERIELTFSDSKGKGLQFSSTDVESAVLQIAAEKPYHPVRDYLNGLQWDGQERIHRLLAEVLHSEPTDTKQRIMRWWMISAVARGLNPGCKVDSVLILQGEQGRKKSMFFSTLVGKREWFSDSQVDLQNKDAYQLLHSCWIWEWGELETLMRARRMSAVKNFVSSAQDSFRAPYAKTTRLYLRSSVIVGSTNEKEFLSDPTGHRRWWVVDVHGRVNYALLADWRDQLWAEAVTYYRANELWYAEGEEEEGELTELAQQYEVRDAWEELILNWAAAPRDASLEWQPFSTADVLTQALEKPIGQWTRGDEMRVVDILARAGYKKDRNATERALGGRSRLWRQGQVNVAPRA
jgi:putative DNA primase/helicase